MGEVVRAGDGVVAGVDAVGDEDAGRQERVADGGPVGLVRGLPVAGDDGLRVLRSTQRGQGMSASQLGRSAIAVPVARRRRAVKGGTGRPNASPERR